MGCHTALGTAVLILTLGWQNWKRRSRANRADYALDRGSFGPKKSALIAEIARDAHE